jgi:hypothetical protein
MLHTSILRGLTPKLTGAGARSVQGTNMGHEHAEGMAHVGVHVERTVRPGALVRGDGTTMVLHFMCHSEALHPWCCRSMGSLGHCVELPELVHRATDDTGCNLG